jgi:hypothetical protein
LSSFSTWRFNENHHKCVAIDVNLLPASQPYTPHPFDVLCEKGHVLTTAAFRVAKGRDSSKGEAKVWAMSHTENVVPKTKNKDAGVRETYVVNIPKTIECCTLNPEMDDCVMKVSAVCKECDDNRTVGTLYRNYVDCSDFSVDGGAPRFQAKALELMLLRRDDCRLQARFHADGKIADIVAFSGVAGDDKSNAERLLVTLLQAKPKLASLLGVDGAPPQPDMHWIRKLELDVITTPERRYVLSTALARHFSRAFERLQTGLTVAGNFLLASGAQHPKRAKVLIQQMISGTADGDHANITGAYSAAVRTFFNKRGALVNADAVRVLRAEATSTQARQMHALSRPQVDDYRAIDEISLIFITRNVVAHSQDDSGLQRRHLLRLFTNAVGGRDVAGASDLVHEAIRVLQLDTKLDLFQHIVAVKDSTASPAQIAVSTAELHRIVAQIRADVNLLPRL